jgi:DNA-binding PadR family transcriptional regulator
MRERSTAYVILGVLAIGGDLSGYEIRQWLKQAVGFFWSESFGQIYPELQSLTKDGFIKPLPATGKGRNAQRYRLLKPGEAKLRAWLQKKPQPERPRSEALLKLFFGAVAGPSAAQSVLRETTAMLDARAGALAEAQKAILNESASPNLVYSLISVLSGLSAVEARAVWAKDSQMLLDAHAKGGNDAVLRAYDKLRRRASAKSG